MTKLFRHSILLLAAVCLVVSCKDKNSISSDELGTDGIQQGKVSYDTLNVDIRPATGDTIDLDQAVAIGLKLVSLSGPQSVTPGYYNIIGYVSGFSDKDSESSLKQYGNRFPIITNKLGNRRMLCYQMLNYRMEKFTEMEQLEIGDQIVVCGHIQNYSNTPQIAGGFLLTSDNVHNPEPPAMDITLRDAVGDTITIDEAISIGMGLPSGTDASSKTSKTYKVIGYVKGFSADESKESFPNDFPKYGNRYPILTNQSGNRFMMCYRLMGINGKKFTDLNQLEVGDQVVVEGIIQNYQNSPQVASGKLLVTTNPNATARVVVNETFDQSIGSFTIVDKTPASAPVWAHIDAKNGNPGCMRATAKINGAVEEAESWLVSPAMDLTVCTHGAQITFTQYFVGDKAERDELLQIVASLDGGNTWHQIPTTDAMWNDGTLPQFQTVTIDLEDYITAQTQIAFAYKSTSEKAFTWAIKNLTIGEKPF